MHFYGITMVNATGDIKHTPIGIQHIDYLIVQNQTKTAGNNLQVS